MKKAMILLPLAFALSACKNPFARSCPESGPGKYEVLVHKDKIYMVNTREGAFWEKDYGVPGWTFIPLDMKPPAGAAKKTAEAAPAVPEPPPRAEARKKPPFRESGEEFSGEGARAASRADKEAEFEKRIRAILEEIEKAKERNAALAGLKRETPEDVPSAAAETELPKKPGIPAGEEVKKENLLDKDLPSENKEERMQ